MGVEESGATDAWENGKEHATANVRCTYLGLARSGIWRMQDGVVRGR